MKNKIFYWRVNTTALLSEIANNGGNISKAVARPLDILGKILYAVASRARELGDEELNSLMCRLALYEQADKYSEHYDERTEELISKFDEATVKRIKS